MEGQSNDREPLKSMILLGLVRCLRTTLNPRCSSWTISVIHAWLNNTLRHRSHKERATQKTKGTDWMSMPPVEIRSKQLQSVLLQRRRRRACTGGRIVTDHTRLVGVESARARSVRRNRVAVHGITRQRRARAVGNYHELVKSAAAEVALAAGANTARLLG